MSPRSAAASGAAIRKSPSRPKAKVLLKAYTICSYAHSAAREVMGIFDQSRRGRRTTGGQTTDAEQDLLRAMLVFASAGLDATLKQIVKDALSDLVRANTQVEQHLAIYASRRIRRPRAQEDPSQAVDVVFLGRMLAGASPQTALIAHFVEDAIGESLQSAKEVVGLATKLGIAFEALGIEKKKLEAVFEVRNKIVHEMDINLEGRQRKRVSRTIDEMLPHINLVLELSEAFMTRVDQQLSVSAIK